jgi:hypothetical protein
MLVLKIYQFEMYQLNFLKGGGAVLLLWVNTPPFGINRKKRRLFEPSLFSPH